MISSNKYYRAFHLFVVFSVSISQMACSSRTVVSEQIGQSNISTDGERGGPIYSLPKTLITIMGTSDPKAGITYTITPSIMPDSKQRYRMRYAASSWSDDDVSLQVDTDGLLTSTQANTTDRIGDVIVVLAKTAATLATVAAPIPGGSPPVGPSDTANAYPFTKIFDLNDTPANRELSLPDSASVIFQDWKPKSSTLAPSDCQYSICYRTTVPVRGTISRGVRSVDFAFVGINQDIEGVDLNTALLVNRKNTAIFKSGLLLSLSISKPSSALAVVSLPLNVIKAIFSAPAELLNLKITNVQDEASLATQQKALINANDALKASSTTSTSKPAVTAVAGTGAAP